MNDFKDFLRWLDEHGYCKATPCIDCYYWGTYEQRHSSDPECRVIRTCRQWKTKTYNDDYCSRHLMKVKKGEQNGIQ